METNSMPNGAKSQSQFSLGASPQISTNGSKIVGSFSAEFSDLLSNATKTSEVAHDCIPPFSGHNSSLSSISNKNLDAIFKEEKSNHLMEKNSNKMEIALNTADIQQYEKHHIKKENLLIVQLGKNGVLDISKIHTMSKSEINNLKESQIGIIEARGNKLCMRRGHAGFHEDGAKHIDRSGNEWVIEFIPDPEADLIQNFADQYIVQLALKLSEPEKKDKEENLSSLTNERKSFFFVPLDTAIDVKSDSETIHFVTLESRQQEKSKLEDLVNKEDEKQFYDKKEEIKDHIDKKGILQESIKHCYDLFTTQREAQKSLTTTLDVKAVPIWAPSPANKASRT